MELSLTQQALLVLYAVAVGMIAGALYDLFRIFRIAFGGKAAAVFVQDLFFWLVCACGIFLFFLYFNGGQVRLYCFPGFAGGAALYFLTISRFVIRFSRFFINKVKKIIKYILHLVYLPIIIMIGRIKAALNKPVAFLNKKAEPYVLKHQMKVKQRKREKRKKRLNRRKS